MENYDFQNKEKHITGGYESSSYLYKLLHIGRINRSSNSAGYSICCYFQRWHPSIPLAFSDPVVTSVVSSDFADRLIVGSLWTQIGECRSQHCLASADSRLFWAGARPLQVDFLKNVVNLNSLHPSSFWISQGQTWVAYTDVGEERLLIPCFELLRILFFSSPALTRFFFSHLPVEFLCRPHSTPNQSYCE